MSRLKYWVWLASLPNVRARTKKLLVERTGGAFEAYFMLRGDYRELGFVTPAEQDALGDKNLDAAMRAIDSCARQDISIITLSDAAYPRRLAGIYDPPAVLYVRGRLPDIDGMCAVAVVGTRGATPYGVKMAQRMGYGLAAGGGLVVSGLTRGVDAAAARGALLAGGSCVGVLGTAIDAVQPADGIANDVALFGALVSEYGPGSSGGAFRFRERNRITSGLSVAALVVEAPAKSGALLFADEALSQGREVFAGPANADSQNAAGSNRLLMEGAHPALEAWDVLGEFAAIFPALDAMRSSAAPRPQLEAEAVKSAAEDASKPEAAAGRGERPALPRGGKRPAGPGEAKKDIDKPEPEEYIDLVKQLEGLSAEQLAVISAITEPHTHVDDIIERCGLAASKVLGELTLLRIKGCVLEEPGKRYSLNITRK